MFRQWWFGLIIGGLAFTQVFAQEYQQILSVEHIQRFVDDFEQQTDAEQAEAYAVKALSWLPNENYLLRLAILHKLGRLKFKSGQPKETVELNLQAIQFASRFNAKKPLSQAWNDLGIGHYYLGEFSKALEAYEQSLELRKELGEQQKVGDSLNNIGLIHSQMGDYDLALDYYQQAYQKYIKTNSREDVADILGNMAGIFLHLKNYSKALEYYQDALTSYQRVGSQENIVLTIGNIGVVYSRLGQYEQALEHQQQVVEQSIDLGLTFYLGGAYNNISAIEIKRKNWSKALQYAQRAVEQLKANDIKILLANAYHSAAQAYQGLEQLGYALIDAERSLEIAEQLEDKVQLRDSLLLLSELNERAGNYQQALEQFKRLKRLDDERSEQSRQQSLAKAQSRFELVKQKNEIELLRQEKHLQSLEIEQQHLYSYFWLIVIALLFSIVLWWVNRYSHRKQIEDQQVINAKLAHIDKLKTEFLSETSEQLLQPINEIIKLSRSPEEPKNAEKVSSIAQSMEVLVHDISDFSKLKNKTISLKKESLDIKSIITELSPLIVGFLNKRGLEFVEELAQELPQVSGDKGRLVQVLHYLIIFAANNCQQGKITVSAQPFNHYLKVSVRDTGEGLEQELVERIFDSYDLFEASIEDINISNFSLAVARMLVEQHGGRITMSSQIGQGTICSFTLPLVNQN